MFLILDHLDFGDLLIVAQISDKFSMVASDLFRRKYSNLQIVISQCVRPKSVRDESPTVSQSKIELKNVD